MRTPIDVAFAGEHATILTSTEVVVLYRDGDSLSVPLQAAPDFAIRIRRPSGGERLIMGLGGFLYPLDLWRLREIPEGRWMVRDSEPLSIALNQQSLDIDVSGTPPFRLGVPLVEGATPLAHLLVSFAGKDLVAIALYASRISPKQTSARVRVFHCAQGGMGHGAAWPKWEGYLRTAVPPVDAAAGILAIVTQDKLLANRADHGVWVHLGLREPGWQVQTCTVSDNGERLACALRDRAGDIRVVQIDPRRWPKDQEITVIAASEPRFPKRFLRGNTSVTPLRIAPTLDWLVVEVSGPTPTGPQTRFVPARLA